MAISLERLRTERRLTETKSDGSFYIFTQRCFNQYGGGGEYNRGQTWLEFKEAAYPPTTDNIASTSDAGSFVVFIVPIAAVKQLFGTETNTSTGAIAPLPSGQFEINVCKESTLVDIVNTNTTRANVLTALRALTEFVQPTSLASKTPTMCVVTVTNSAASRSLSNLDLEFYSTGV